MKLNLMRTEHLVKGRMKDHSLQVDELERYRQGLDDDDFKIFLLTHN